MTTSAYERTSPRGHSGFTLVEMMIAMAIGMVLILGAVTIYANGRQSFRTFENIARIQDNARFAVEMMAPDIRLAGFWGRTNEAAFINVPGAVAVNCGGADVTAWAMNLNTGVAGVDDNYNLPCAPFFAAQANTDVLVLRHASGQPTPAVAGVMQVQTTRTAGQVFNTGIVPGGFLPAPASATHDVNVHAYYVDQASSVGGLPSLRRQTLVGNQIQDQEIIPGVENMQVQFGVDTDQDGTVERYVDPDSVIITPGAVGFNPLAEILAVRVWLLVRGEFQENAFVNDATYTPPDANLLPITPNDNLRRMQLSTTIFLRNQ